MKLTAVQEEKEAGSGSTGQACAWQAVSSGIPQSMEHACPPTAASATLSRQSTLWKPLLETFGNQTGSLP